MWPSSPKTGLGEIPDSVTWKRGKGCAGPAPWFLRMRAPRSMVTASRSGRGTVPEETARALSTRGVTGDRKSKAELQSQSKLIRRPPTSPLFPYTTLFRSEGAAVDGHGVEVGQGHGPRGDREGLVDEVDDRGLIALGEVESPGAVLDELLDVAGGHDEARERAVAGGGGEHEVGLARAGRPCGRGG